MVASLVALLVEVVQMIAGVVEQDLGHQLMILAVEAMKTIDYRLNHLFQVERDLILEEAVEHRILGVAFHSLRHSIGRVVVPCQVEAVACSNLQVVFQFLVAAVPNRPVPNRCQILRVVAAVPTLDPLKAGVVLVVHRTF